jgi:hypothetical protein
MMHLGIANGGELDIPTDRIPLHLRAIGSRFVLIWQSTHPEPQDSADVIRGAIWGGLTIEESSESR